MNSNIQLALDTRRKKADGTFPIIPRLGHSRRTVGIPTGYAIPEQYWDEKTRKIKKGCPGIENITRVNNLLDKERTRALDVLTRLSDRDELRFLSIGELKEMIDKKDQDARFFDFTADLVANLRKQNRIGTADYYDNVLREIKLFRNGKDFPVRELTYKFLIKFESYYLGKGLEVNGLNVYMCGIKAIYNRAVKAGLIDKDHPYPFKDYTIKNKPTLKRARHFFFLSLSAWGASFIDLAFLKLSNIVDGRIIYRRRGEERLGNSTTSR